MFKLSTKLTIFTVLLVPLIYFGIAGADSTISRAYNTNSSIPSGSLVSLEKNNGNYVDPANSGNGQNLVGVAVNGNQSLLAVNPSSGTVQVASDGSVNILISTVNGNISIGNQISVSPFNGVGMKASVGSRVIGLAQSSFNSSSSSATNENVTDKNGHTHQIIVGYVKVTIAIGTADNANSALSSLQNVVEALVGHPISNIRIIFSLVVAVAAIISIITLVYASIYSSIISVGRNPLAKYAVLRTLSSVMGMVVLIAIISSTTIYLLLV